MKKLVSIILMTLLIVVMGGCGSGATDPVSSTPTMAPPTNTPVPVVPTAVPPTPTPAPDVKQAIMILYPRFEEQEYGQTRQALEESGIEVVVAAPSMQSAQGHRGTDVEPDIMLQDAHAADYDAIIFIGAYGFDFGDQEAIRLAQEAVAEGKVLAAICAAPKLLAQAGLLQGKRATTSLSPSVLENEGGVYTGSVVERDGLIITANGPRASTQFGTEIATVVQSGASVTSISLAQADQIEKLYTFDGHSGSVTGFDFLADGARLASSDVDLTLRLWNVQDGQLLHSLQVGGGNSYNAAFSSNGVLWAAESSIAPISIWSVENEQLVHALGGDSGFVMSLAFSPDGTLLATDSNGTIKLWEVESGEQVRIFSGHSSPVGALAFSPDGALLASGSVEGSTDVKLWNVESGEELYTFTEHTDNVYSLAFSPDGTQLVSASGDRTLKLWDVESGDPIHTFMGHRDRIYSVAFSLDGTLLASGGGDGSIKLWDVASGQEVRTLQGHTDLVRPVSFSPDGSFLASGSFDGTVILWGIPR
ncbi:MAG: hypothetical protein GY832_34200 [Chloroflexi bacterium]|nr:hypothetical protein [Chloroflexota bacterium]